MRKEESTSAEIRIIYALSDGPKRFGQLKSETGLTARWLSKLLQRLHEKRQVTRSPQARDEYGLTEEARRKLEPTLRLLRRAERKREFVESDPTAYPDGHRSMSDALMRIIASSGVYFQPALLAFYYREKLLYKYFKEQAARNVEDAYESMTKLSPDSIRALFMEQNLDIRNLTFEQCMKRLPDKLLNI